MVGDMQHRRTGGQRRAQAQDGGDFADLRQGRIGQHALEFLLEQRHDLAVDQCQAAEHQHQCTYVEACGSVAGELRGAEDHQQHLDHAEDTGLGQDAGQRAGDRGGCFRVSQRQPGVHRHEAGLDGETNEQAERGDSASRGIDVGDPGSDVGELEAARLRVQQQNAKVHHVGAGGAHHEVNEAGAQGLWCLFVDDQEVGGPGHQLPEDVEVAELMGARQPEHRAGHQEDEKVVAVAVIRVAHVAVGVKHHQEGDAGDDDGEQVRGGVEAGSDDRQHQGGEGQQHSVQIAHHACAEADGVDDEAADVGHEDQHRPG